MARKIWQYDLGTKPVVHIDMPEFAEVRHAGIDPEGKFCVWMEIDDEAEEMDRHTFGIFANEHTIPDDWTHVATMRVGSIMLHVHHFDKLGKTEEEVES